MLFQRLFSAGWLIACLAFAAIAWGYHAPFSYEPVGPRAFPLLMLGLMAVALAWQLLRPVPLRQAADEPPLDRAALLKVAGCIGLLLVYAGLFEPLGFIASSWLLGAAMARLYGGRWRAALSCSALLSVGLYLLFDKALDVPLPLGILGFLEI
ncbi:tripartite tricarboxylate transporter TctB family protein [Pseudomonas mangiferae]|uniref:Tripartite tricarboxylate transporter TctB family protein n=1 Tax=Pseudomonas mangiferae TaxID=2593654 RepID=A0A553H2F1_9PSED|nr:tripartite tricarboxylate transporter TctB family protein [Pseudomonas mangiferae]TRX75896.1 tripartite tricarboxylate transporter TctB family protein [Pseudomonas mangiferae]